MVTVVVYDVGESGLGEYVQRRKPTTRSLVRVRQELRAEMLPSST